MPDETTHNLLLYIVKKVDLLEKKIDMHDLRFEKIDVALKGHSALIAEQNKKLTDMDQNIVMFRDQILTALDPITTRLNLHEEERIITN